MKRSVAQVPLKAGVTVQVVILSLIADGSCTLNKTETVTIARMDMDNDTLQLELIERRNV